MSGNPEVTLREAIEKRRAAEASILQILKDFSETTGLKVDAVDQNRTAMGELYGVSLRVRMPD